MLYYHSIFIILLCIIISICVFLSYHRLLKVCIGLFVGLLILELLCFVGVFVPGLYGWKIGGSEWFGVGELVVCGAGVWLFVFVMLDIRDILKASSKFN